MGASSTVSVKFWVAFEPTPFAAVMTIAYVLPVPAAGVPLSTPVVVFKVTPDGKAPVSLNIGAGKPVAVTVKVPPVPTVNVAIVPLVNTGVASTVNVKLCDAVVPTPLLAVKVME